MSQINKLFLMGKFITTTEISSMIERTIKDSEDFIILVTPFIQVHSRLKKIIERKLSTSDVQLNIICRDEHPSEERIWLQELNNRINILFTNNLHAKCFLNESQAILTSMNLYHYSMVNNIEFGVHFERKIDYENYSEIIEEVINLGLGEINFRKRNVKSKIIEFDQLLEDTGSTSLSFIKDIKGNESLCLFKGNEKTVSIKVGSEIILKNQGDERVDELIGGHYNMYLIERFNNPYYQFRLDK